MDPQRLLFLAAAVALCNEFMLLETFCMCILAQGDDGLLEWAAGIAWLQQQAVVAAGVATSRIVLPPMPRRFPSLHWRGPGMGFEQAGLWIHLQKPRWEAWERAPGQLADVTDRMYIEFFRLDEATFWMICNTYGHLWRKQDTLASNTVSVPWRLAIFLFWMAFGETQRPIAILFGVSDSLVSEICNEIAYIFNDHVYPATVLCPTPDDLVALEGHNRHKYHLPNCIGSIDGTFFHILQPEEDERAFFCYKKYYAIILLAWVDKDLKFMWFCAGSPGSVGDAAVWNSTDLNHRMCTTRQFDVPPVFISPSGNLVASPLGATRVDSYVVADSAFRLTRRCMKIFADERGNPMRKDFNDRVISCRRGSELAFGRYSGRWKIVKWNKINNPEFATVVAKAAAALHNICQARSTEYRQGWEAETDPRRQQKEQDRAAGMRAAMQAARTAANNPITNAESRSEKQAAAAVRNALVAYVGAHP